MKIQPDIARDEADVQSLLSTLEGLVNLFQSQGKTSSVCSQERWPLRMLFVMDKPKIWAKEPTKSLARKGWRLIPRK